MSAIIRQSRLLLGTFSLLSATTGFAAMGNLATSYGVLPTDVASAQSLSLFNSQVSAVYYNPAYLATDPRGELTAGMFHADHELEVNSLGGNQPLQRNGSVVLDSPSQQVLLGLKTNLTSMTRLEHPLYLGFMLGVEKFSEEMMAFQSGTSEQGQFLTYGRQPLFLNLGGATNLWRGIDAGLSTRITLHSTASLQAQSDLAGNTKYESLNVEAKPVLRPIFGLNVDWGRTLCPGVANCWANGFETALSYRGYSTSRTTVAANAVVEQTIPSPGLTMAIQTISGYQPNIIAAGIQYKTPRWRVGLTGEWQEWSRLGEEFQKDTIKDQAQLKFTDVLIPRLGAEFKLNEMFSVTAGVAFEKSALDSRTSLDVNYLDNDRIVFGLGGATEIKEPWVLAYPLRLDFGYQYHMLKDRTFDLTTSRPELQGQNPYETVEASGQVHVFAGSMTLKF